MRDNAVYDDVIQFAANLERALLVDMLGKFLAICDEQRDTLVAHVVSSLRSPIPPPSSTRNSIVSPRRTVCQTTPSRHISVGLFVLGACFGPTPAGTGPERTTLC